MSNEQFWLSILGGAANSLFSIIPPLIKERIEKRRIARAKETSTDLVIKDEPTLITVFEAIPNLSGYGPKIDRVRTLEELIRNEARIINDLETESRRPGISYDARIGIKQDLEDRKDFFYKCADELQDLLEEISGHKIEL